MCNRYASDIRKAGKEKEYYGFEEWSETRINTILEVFPKSVGPVPVDRTFATGQSRSQHVANQSIVFDRPRGVFSNAISRHGRSPDKYSCRRR